VRTRASVLIAVSIGPLRPAAASPIRPGSRSMAAIMSREAPGRICSSVPRAVSSATFDLQYRRAALLRLDDRLRRARRPFDRWT
jgi:hypothetical protein